MPDFTRGAAPPSFATRLSSRQLATGEAAWFFNDPHESAERGAPETETNDTAGLIQIGPLDT